MVKTIIMPFLIVVFLITACSKKGSKTEAKLDLSINFSSIAGLSTSGGSYIFGRNDANGESFHFIPKVGDSTVELDSGSWSFYAFSWAGSAPFEGPLRCGKTNSTIEGEEVTVSINLSQTNCANGFFSPESIDSTTSQPKGLVLYNCADLSIATGATSECTGNLGQASSYRFRMGASGIGTKGESELVSSCYNSAGSANGASLLPLALPLFLMEARVMPLTFETFFEGNCSGRSIEYKGEQGLASFTGRTKTFHDSTNSFLYFQSTFFNPGATIIARTPLSQGEFISTNFMARVKVHASGGNQLIGASANYIGVSSSKSYPEKKNQILESVNFKMVLGQ